jgi:2-methylisocitrate lyase-like PEP mutase family enzyme
MKKTSVLRKLLGREGMLVAPGVCDALGARIVEEAGFEVGYVSGFAVEASYGNPDMGMLTMTEVVTRAASVAEAVELPVICDADTGFGNAVNVIRTVREFEKAGVAGIHLEDQDLPKKCGSFPGKRLISKEEMVGKIHAAVDTRTDPDFLIIARTDAFESGGIEEVIARGRTYEEEGADVIMPILPLTEDQIRGVCTSLSKPNAVVVVESPVRIRHPFAELEKMGVKLAIIPLTLTFSAITAMRRAAKDIKELGSIQPFMERNDSWESILELVGYDRFVQWADKYSGRALTEK